jgi:hypothetical protein
MISYVCLKEDRQLTVNKIGRLQKMNGTNESTGADTRQSSLVKNTARKRGEEREPIRESAFVPQY